MGRIKRRGSIGLDFAWIFCVDTWRCIHGDIEQNEEEKTCMCVCMTVIFFSVGSSRLKHTLAKRKEKIFSWIKCERRRRGRASSSNISKRNRSEWGENAQMATYRTFSEMPRMYRDALKLREWRLDIVRLCVRALSCANLPSLNERKKWMRRKFNSAHNVIASD